jgi:uncharacterized OsmC-like protein
MVDKNQEESVHTSRATIKVIDHAASEIFVRDLEPVISDEKSWNGGQNRGPSPLEYILAGLGA